MCCIPKILKNESNSQHQNYGYKLIEGCVVSQRYSKMKAIHNIPERFVLVVPVVLYPKDTQKWKQFTTYDKDLSKKGLLCCIPKILKNESNSQHVTNYTQFFKCCVVSQRYSKMKAIHNNWGKIATDSTVVLYPKDTQKWKQFTTCCSISDFIRWLCCIPKILKNESNSQPAKSLKVSDACCVVSQRYSKMKAIHNPIGKPNTAWRVVLYPKDTQKWKQFTTLLTREETSVKLCCIPKILKNESNSQLLRSYWMNFSGCVVSQRYSKMKAIHNEKTRFCN